MLIFTYGAHGQWSVEKKIPLQMGCAHFNDHESNADNDPKILTQEPQTASKCCITSLLSKAMAISRDDLPVLFCLSGSAPASNNTSIFIEFYRGT